MLGRETRRLIASPSRLHAVAREILEELDIPIRDTMQLVGSLTGAQRQLLAIATAMGRRPRLLLLDEPTASLGLVESAQVEARCQRSCARRHRRDLGPRHLARAWGRRIRHGWCPSSP
jgi:ABC-type sugar transport system ATPase subunit